MSHPILIKMRDEHVKVLEMGESLPDILEKTKIGEILDIKPTDHPVLRALENTFFSAESLNTTMNTLELQDVFEDPGKGLLALLDPWTPINEIADKLQEAVNDANIYRLRGLKIFSVSFDTDDYQSVLRKASMLNASPSDILDAVAKNKPITDIATAVVITSDQTLNLNDLDPNTFVTISSGVTVTIEGGKYSQTAANIKLLSGATLKIEGVVIFEDTIGYMLIDNELGGNIVGSDDLPILPSNLYEFFIAGEVFGDDIPNVSIGCWEAANYTPVISDGL